MATYGLFQSGAVEPYQTFEGNSISQNGEFVQILDKELDVVATIRLNQGQYIKKLEASSQRGY